METDPVFVCCLSTCTCTCTPPRGGILLSLLTDRLEKAWPRLKALIASEAASMMVTAHTYRHEYVPPPCVCGGDGMVHRWDGSLPPLV